MATSHMVQDEGHALSVYDALGRVDHFGDERYDHKLLGPST